MNITAIAYAHIPAYDNHGAAIERLKEHQKRIIAEPILPKITVTSFEEAALDNEPFPKDVAKHNRIVQERNQHKSDSAYMIREAIRSLTDKRRTLVRDHSNKALAYLDGELRKLMEEVRQVHSVLGTIRTAEQVLAADDDEVTEAWKRVQAVSAVYAEIRSAQKTITSAVLDEGQGFIIASTGHIRNSLELSGYWLHNRSNNTDINAARDPLAAVQNFDKWIGGGTVPRFPYTTGTYSGSEQWEYLVWLATEATPWVPTVEDLLAAYKAANTAISRVDYRSVKNQEEARDEYFRIIGEKPILAYTSSPTNQRVPERKSKRSGWGDTAARAMGI